jgi:hypothetical protein
VVGLARVAVERVEHDGVGAKQAQLLEVVDDLIDRALAGKPGGLNCDVGGEI